MYPETTNKTNKPGLIINKERLLDNSSGVSSGQIAWQNIYENGKKIYHELLDFFVKSGDRRWWWENFKQDSFDFNEYEHPFEHLSDLIPDLNENVWLMVEDEHEDYYPIYDCKPSIIGLIIGECFGFEYYVIDKNKEWLICENHHNRLIGVGQILKDKNKDKIK